MNLRRRLQNYIALNNYVEAFRSNVLPDEYTQLEYITGDGNAYIDLGLPLTQDDSIEIDFIAKYTTGAQIFGYRDNASSNNIMLFTGSGSNSIFLDFNNSDYAPYRLSTTTVNGSEYKAISNKNIRQFLDSNGNVIAKNTTACLDTITTGNAYLFFANGSPSGNNKFIGSIKKVIISDRMHLIPAKRNSDNVVGMFDLISNKFFTNVNTVGSFIAGPNVSKTPYSNKVYLEDSIKDGLSSLNVYGKVIQSNIPEGYTQLEYIESTGTQYINTGLRENLTDYMELKFETVDDSSGFMLANTSTQVGVKDARYGTTNPGTYIIKQKILAGRWNFTNETNGTTYLNGIPGFNYLYLFNLYNIGSTDYRNKNVKVYYYKASKNDNLVFNAVPAKRNSDNVVGMYDTVSGQFLTNAGTGDFVAGPAIAPTPDNPIDIYCSNGKLVFRDPDVPSEYKRLLDIIFDGDIYYVTNTYLTGADTTTFIMNATENGRNVLGCYTGSGSGNNISFYLSTGNSGNYVRYKDNLYRPILANSKLNTDVTLSIGPTGTTGFDTDATWTELEFVSPDAFYIGWLANASSPKFKGSFIGNITVSNRANFIPCERVSDGAIGYYDTYSNTFFEKQGTGTPTTSGYDYSHHTVIADGIPEKLNIKGNNLYDITKDVNDKYIDANGNIGDDTSLRACYSDLIPVKSGEMYTYSGICKSSSGASNTKRIHGYIDGVWNQQIQALNININKPFSYTFTIPANINGIRISHWKDDEKTQLEECYRPTKYNNYIDMNLDVANLLSIGDYIDSQDILNGSIIRNVGVKVLNGTEEFNPSTLTNCWTLSENIGRGNFTDRTVYCTHFNHSTTLLPASDRQGYAFIGNSGSYYTVGFGATTLFPTQTQFKQWLADQYAVGTPVIIVYPLADTVEETVESRNVFITSGTNTIERNSEYVSSGDITVGYKKLR